jgi:hypothetical protein
MKKIFAVVIISFCLFVGIGRTDLSAYAITAAFLGPSWTVDKETIVNAAIAEWTSCLTLSQDMNLTFDVRSLGGSTLGQTAHLSYYTATELPYSASITIDTRTSISWNLTQTVTGYYDALTIIAHEIGHAIGIAYYFPDYIENVTYSGSYAYVDGYKLYSTSNLSHLADSSDLMSPYISAGVRNVPSSADIDILCDIYGYQVKADAVPLPSAILLLGPGLLTLAGVRRFVRKPARDEGIMCTSN